MTLLFAVVSVFLVLQACLAGTPPAPCGDAKQVDVLIVGGGWSAVMALKTILKYPTISIKVVEKADEFMGRAKFARWMNGGIGENLDGTKNFAHPLPALIKEYWPDDFEDYKADWFFGTPTSEQGNYYDTSGQSILAAEVDSLHTEFEGVYKCLRERADEFIVDAAFTPDRTFRQVLEDDCSWSDPADGTRRDLAEFIRIDWEWGSTSEKMGLYNFPDVSDIDFGEIGWYLTNPNGSMGSAADVGFMFISDPAQGRDGSPLMNFMEKGRGVQKIYWDTNDGSDFPVRVTTSSEATTCADIVTKKVIYTPSIGVLERRGDCKHASGGTGTNDGCDPSAESIVMFDPVLPKAKMDAVRRLHIDDARGDLAGMIEYREVRFEFKTKFWDTKIFHLFEKEGGRSGCFVWQNLDQEGFYPGSKSVVCTLSTYEWDALVDPVNKTLTEDQVNEFLNDSFGKLAGGNLNCSETDPETWKSGSSTIPVDRDCVYSYFSGWTEDQDNDQYDDWYGSYVVWNLGATQGTLDQDFENYLSPVVSNGQERVHISGTGSCDRHQGYTVGAYYAGIKSAQTVIRELTGIVDTTPQYCDEGPFKDEEPSCPCKRWQIFCFILHIFRGCLFHRN